MHESHKHEMSHVPSESPHPGRESTMSPKKDSRESREPKIQSKSPRNLRDVLPLGPIARSLPSYEGPYSVGVMEIEIPVETPRNFAKGLEDYGNVLRLDTVLMCVYYPSAFGSGAGDDSSGQKGWSRQTWLPRPREKTSNGYAKFAKLPPHVAKAFFASTTWLTKLPAFRNAPLAEHWAPDVTVAEAGLKVQNEMGEPPEGLSEHEKPTFPLMMFSHGLGGHRTMYSSICGNFASFGFVVCAVEHRDGSAARTYVLREPDNEDKIADEDSLNKFPPRRIDYIFPKNNPLDTAPLNDKGVDMALRKAQLRLRQAEIQEAYHIISMICAGDGKLIGKRNLRKKGHTGSSSRGLEGVDWSGWKGRVHLQQVTMVGHSFGAATTAEVLRRREDEFPYITQGIIYDVWGAPIHRPSPDDPASRINCPLLGINSEAFMYWAANFEKALSLVKESALHDTDPPENPSKENKTSRKAAADRNQDLGAHQSYLMTIPGTVHLSTSDFPILYPHIVSIFLNATISPERAIELNIRASLEFLRKVLPSHISAVERTSKSVGLLEVSPMLGKAPIKDGPGRPRREQDLAIKLGRKRGLFESIMYKLTPASMKGDGAPKTREEEEFGGRDDIWMHFAPGSGSGNETKEEDGTGHEDGRT